MSENYFMTDWFKVIKQIPENWSKFQQNSCSVVEDICWNTKGSLGNARKKSTGNQMVNDLFCWVNTTELPGADCPLWHVKAETIYMTMKTAAKLLKDQPLNLLRLKKITTTWFDTGK